MIYEDDLKTVGKIGNKVMIVRGEIKFAGEASRPMEDGGTEARKALRKEIKDGMLKGLGDLFYGEARGKLFELQMALNKQMTVVPTDILMKLEAVSSLLKIQPGACPDPNIVEINGEKAVKNA